MQHNDNPKKEKTIMGYSKEMAETINELRNIAAAVNDIANWLAKTFSSDEKLTDEPAPTDKEQERTLSYNEVRTILADKSRKGCTALIRGLLRKYGASKLSEVDPTHYKALIKDVMALSSHQGAKNDRNDNHN